MEIWTFVFVVYVNIWSHTFCTVNPQKLIPWSLYALMNLEKKRAQAVYTWVSCLRPGLELPSIFPLPFIHAGGLWEERGGCLVLVFFFVSNIICSLFQTYPRSEEQVDGLGTGCNGILDERNQPLIVMRDVEVGQLEIVRSVVFGVTGNAEITTKQHFISIINWKGIKVNS
jgi:hypothetical protein